MSDSGNSYMSRWWHQDEARAPMEFKIECSRCGAAAFVDNAAGEMIQILCSNELCDNDFEIHNIHA